MKSNSKVTFFGIKGYIYIIYIYTLYTSEFLCYTFFMGLKTFLHDRINNKIQKLEDWLARNLTSTRYDETLKLLSNLINAQGWLQNESGWVGLSKTISEYVLITKNGTIVCLDSGIIYLKSEWSKIKKEARASLHNVLKMFPGSELDLSGYPEIKFSNLPQIQQDKLSEAFL